MRPYMQTAHIRSLVGLQEYPCIGHVRGMGLFVGFELVVPESQKPAPGSAKYIKEGMKARKVLVSTDGHHNQVIKIKPPMCFDKSNVDTLVANLVDLLKPGVPAVVQEVDRAYDPNRKSTRIQNTTWQAVPANKALGV